MTKKGQGADWPPQSEVETVLITREQIQRRIGELGAAISGDYEGLKPRLVGILKGVTPFMADLIRAISIPLTTDYMSIAKYHPEPETTAAVRLLKDLDLSICGEHVLLVEDIIDSGLTMEYILAQLEARGPATLRVCTLFNKTSNRMVDLPLQYVGFELEDVFVVGYGLDYEQRYRNLPYLATVRTGRQSG
ncbi:MAG TPA: hypoxanthine phosphoribosyltransferase [Chloroflexi bacterium]|nr:hypoxanthine phosphoribosyltransferase [Chloroflexota bacterium]